MLDKFWESLGEDLAGEWLKHVFSPAFLFWLGGFGLYVLRFGWQDLWQQISALKTFEQAAILLLALLILILSSVLIKNLRFNVLRLLEGYWPWPFSGLADWLAGIQNWLFERREKRWNSLKAKEKHLSPHDARTLVELEMSTHYFPADPKDIQPTPVGNILRAGETASMHKYGLDAFACWPRLWLLLPETAREDLSAARQGMMTFVELWAWGLLFLVWTVWSSWAILVSVLGLWLAYILVQQAAMAYADLLESAFDLYRWDLYNAARWPLPETSGAAEIAAGQYLTEFLWRGTSQSPIQYVPPTDK
jgi:hypothetical protein